MPMNRALWDREALSDKCLLRTLARDPIRIRRWSAPSLTRFRNREFDAWVRRPEGHSHRPLRHDNDQVAHLDRDWRPEVWLEGDAHALLAGRALPSRALRDRWPRPAGRWEGERGEGDGASAHSSKNKWKSTVWTLHFRSRESEEGRLPFTLSLSGPVYSGASTRRAPAPARSREQARSHDQGMFAVGRPAEHSRNGDLRPTRAWRGVRPESAAARPCARGCIARPRLRLPSRRTDRQSAPQPVARWSDASGQRRWRARLRAPER